MPLSWLWLADARRDVPYALRALARAPGFSAVAIITLALGVGATTAIFSIVNTVLLRPLPYAEADRLVRIVENVPAAGSRPAFRRAAMSQAEFLEWRRRTKTLDTLAVASSILPMVSGPDGAVQVLASAVSPAIFSMLGAGAMHGRALGAADENGASPVVVLSSAAWQRYFASSRDAIGRTLVINDRTCTVVGVMPPDFAFPSEEVQFWIPAVLRPEQSRALLGTVARLHRGVSVDAAAAEANAIGAALRPVPATQTTRVPVRFEVERLHDQLVAPVRPALRVLSVAVGVVLLIVCANIASLLLARGTARQREIAIRLAVGASRARVVRQVLTESLVLSVAGGLADALLAFGAVRLVRGLGTVNAPGLFAASFGANILPRLNEIRVDVPVLLFALGASVATGLLFGVVPALQMARGDHARAIGYGSGSTASGAAGARGGRLRNVLVVAQLGLATVLLVGAGLLIHSFIRLSNVNTGYDPASVLTFQLGFPRQYPVSRKVAVVEGALARLASLQQVAAAGFTHASPLLGISESLGALMTPGRTLEESLERRAPQIRSVSADYLRAMGVRLVEGRWFDERDTAGAPPALLVNRSVVRQHFDNASPIGALVRLERWNAQDLWQIVGVVDDLRQGRLDQEPDPMVFADYRQILGDPGAPGRPRDGLALGFLVFAVRVNGDPAMLVPDVRSLMRELDPAVGLDAVATMESLVSKSVMRPRFLAVVLGIFAAIAGVLAVVGIYGVLAYSVVQRTPEIGIRMALGAQSGEVLRLMLRQGLLLTAIGITIGVAGAVAVSRYLTGMLFGLTAVDRPTYAAVALVFAAVAALASYVPARRATKVDPLVALRCE